MFEVTLPGIVTADELAEKREGFAVAGIRYDAPGFDLGGLDADETTTFLFAGELEAGMFKMMWG